MSDQRDSLVRGIESNVGVVVPILNTYYSPGCGPHHTISEAEPKKLDVIFGPLSKATIGGAVLGILPLQLELRSNATYLRPEKYGGFAAITDIQGLQIDELYPSDLTQQEDEGLGVPHFNPVEFANLTIKEIDKYFSLLDAIVSALR